MKKIRRILPLVMALGLAIQVPMTSLACTMIYVGSELTEDGGMIFARSEDMGNSSEKLFYVSKAGEHKKDEVYEGCFGFTFTFTHDSYSYTAFRDNNLCGGEMICPDCGEVKEGHTPYEEAGTNEKGVSLTATESLYPNANVQDADPFTDEGIEEADMATVLLSEASSAKHALDILLAIWDNVGSNSAAGVLIADQKEAWYVENATGHEYLAVRLPKDMIFIQPNVSVLGIIDLDDKENVIASKGIIETAKAAGTFVGDEEKNVIDYRASYFNRAEDKDLPEDEYSFDSRLVNGLNYLNKEYAITEDNICDSAFTITNVDVAGNIVKLSTPIKTDRKMSLNDVVQFYKVEDIGYFANESTSIFQIYADCTDKQLSTIEWLTLANDQFNAVVPYYPMLTTDVYEAYHVGLVEADVTKEEPTQGEYYFFPSRGGRYITFPEGWQNSYYWSLDALAEQLTFGDTTPEDEALVRSSFNELQASIYKDFAEARTEIGKMSKDKRSVYATEFSKNEAKRVHELANKLYIDIFE